MKDEKHVIVVWTQNEATGGEVAGLELGTVGRGLGSHERQHALDITGLVGVFGLDGLKLMSFECSHAQLVDRSGAKIYHSTRLEYRRRGE